MWSLFQFSILTGIDDDPMEVEYDPDNLYQVGSRVRGLSDLPSVMATRPPYILEQVPPPAELGDSPQATTCCSTAEDSASIAATILQRNAGSFAISSMVVCWLLLRSSESSC